MAAKTRIKEVLNVDDTTTFYVQFRFCFIWWTECNMNLAPVKFATKDDAQRYIAHYKRKDKIKYHYEEEHE